MAVWLGRAADSAREGLLVDMHAEELELKPVQMGDVRDEVHEVGESNPEHMLHVEVFGSRVAVFLQNLSNRRVVEIRFTRLDEHPSSDSPQIHALSRRRFAFLPAGIYCESDQRTVYDD